MGAERSLGKLKASGKVSVTLRRLEQLSHRWGWVERCRGYDDYLERQARASREKERRSMLERHARIAMLAQNVLVKGLENLLRHVQEQDGAIKAGDLARLLETSVKVERLAKGEPTDVQENVGPGGGPIQIDHRAFVYAVRRARGFRDPEWAEIEAGNKREITFACQPSGPLTLPPNETDESR